MATGLFICHMTQTINRYSVSVTDTEKYTDSPVLCLRQRAGPSMEPNFKPDIRNNLMRFYVCLTLDKEQNKDICRYDPQVAKLDLMEHAYNHLTRAPLLLGGHTAISGEKLEKLRKAGWMSGDAEDFLNDNVSGDHLDFNLVQETRRFMDAQPVPIEGRQFR